MFEIDRIPTSVLASVAAHGIAAEELLLACHCDRTRELEMGDSYLFATEKELLILSGRTSIRRREDRRRRREPAIESVWEETELVRYPITELGHFRNEELLSAGRLTALCGEEPILLASYTNFCKASAMLFAKYAARLAKGESIEVDPRDDPSYKRCPKCGLRYPDLNRRICPHCMEKGKLYLRLSKFFLQYRGYLAVMLLSLVALTVMSILVPYLSSGFFYDEVIFGTGKFAGELLLVLGLILSTRLLKLLSTILNNYVTSTVAAKMVFDLKRTIFSAIERLSLRFFTGKQTGGLMTQVNEDATTIYGFFCDGLPYMIVNTVQFAVLVVLLFLIQPLLAALVLLVVPLFLLLMKWIFDRERNLHAKRYASSKRMNSFLADVLSGMRVVKAFSKEREEVARFGDRNRRLAASDRALSLFRTCANPLSGLVLYLGNIIAWGVGGWMIISGRGGMTYGMLLTFIAYMNMVFSPLEFVIDFIDWSADCSNAMQRLFEIMDAQPDVSERENPERPEQLSGKVEFDGVSFSYEKGKKIIDNVSFTVPDGGVLGIVGHTGAGKSTLANLLMRMYDVDEGEIRIGGYPVRDLALSSIYENVAIVSQETYLFMGSILDNIRYARPDAAYGEVIEAAKCAGAHEFIMKLPDAYDTRIGFGYKDLSGGERQRLSIARAILKNPKILILDEATAAMDTGTERRIQEALSKLIEGKTTIMIAHRLSTLRDADELVVIERGKVAEMGTHAELLEREDGVYKKLFSLQEEALRNAGIRE